MLDKLNKIKWSQIPTMTINTHNGLSYNNSKFENLQKEIVKFHFFFINNSIYSSSLFINFFYISFLMTPLNKIPGAATASYNQQFLVQNCRLYCPKLEYQWQQLLPFIEGISAFLVPIFWNFLFWSLHFHFTAFSP